VEPKDRVRTSPIFAHPPKLHSEAGSFQLKLGV
jgi:hypothetical protein